MTCDDTHNDNLIQYSLALSLCQESYTDISFVIRIGFRCKWFVVDIDFHYICGCVAFCCILYSALGTWVFSVAGALIAIPVGIKRKSLAPLVFFGTTGTMLDIIMGISACEREHAERQMKLLEAQNAASEISSLQTGTES